MQEVKVSNKDRSSKKLKDNNISVGEYETRILKRWKTLSFLQTLRLNGIVRMMFISCLIFFKYRIVNKMVVIVTKKDENRLGLFVRISFISLYIGLFLVGERNSFNSVRVSNFQILKRPSIQPLGIFASRLIWFRDHLITYFCVWERWKSKVPLLRKHNNPNSAGYQRLHIVLHAVHWWKAWEDRDAEVESQSDRDCPRHVTRSPKHCSRSLSRKHYW